MIAEGDVVAFRWCGVPVSVRSDSAELARLFTACYDAFPRDVSGAESNLEASCVRDDGGYRVRVTGRRERHERDPIAAARALNHELSQGLMLLRRDLVYVHAAVLEIAGRAVVLPGLSQAGKSTLALALVQRGAGYLSDEMLVFDPATERLLASPRAIKVRDVCVPYFPELVDRFVGTGEARFLAPDAAPAVIAELPGPVRAVILPRWDLAATRMAAVSPGRAYLGLTAAALNFGSHGPTSIDHLAKVVEGASGHALSWSDPLRAADLILEHVAGDA